MNNWGRSAVNLEWEVGSGKWEDSGYECTKCLIPKLGDQTGPSSRNL